MNPVQTDFNNRVFKLVGGTEDNDLPVQSTTINGETVSISTWELEEGELEDIIHSKRVELIVWGVGHPPVALRVAMSDGQPKIHG